MYFRSCFENLFGMNCKQIHTFNVLINKGEPRIIGIHFYRMNIYSILKELKWMPITQLIYSQSLKLSNKNVLRALHKYIHNNYQGKNKETICKLQSLKEGY